jgi:hypothetical protein
VTKIQHESRPNDADRHFATSLVYTPDTATSFIRSAGNTSTYICICLKYPYYLNNPITISTHPKQQQKAEHQIKQQTYQKQKRERRAMTMTTGYPGKQRKRHKKKQNQKSANNERE